MARSIPNASEEFAGARLGDERLNRRLRRLADCVAVAPAAGFPRVSSSDSELEGIYRFLSNERVTPAKILEPHFAKTTERIGASTTLVVHDTTELGFGGAGVREGLGRINDLGQKQGFFVHLALAVAADGSRLPLGIVGLQTFVRSAAKTAAKRFARRAGTPNERTRWFELALKVQERIPKAIHVMDREADSYEIIDALSQARAQFVIRICRDRLLNDDQEERTMFAAADRGQVLVKRTVPLSRRRRRSTAAARKIHPPRTERMAKLRIRASTHELKRPDRQALEACSASLRVNVVTVEEVGTPRDVEPVSWRLVTTEPVDTPAQVEGVVDTYRARWVIEEYFKALKTGCAVERRQLESFRALANALAVFTVIAWRLLLLRSVARVRPDAAASEALTDQQVRVLRDLSRVEDPRVRKVTIPTTPTAQHALAAVAQLGGHLKRNGPPGWQVLGRGYESLLLIELGWRVRDAMAAQKST